MVNTLWAERERTVPRAFRNYLDIQVEYNEEWLTRLSAEFDGCRILHLSGLYADLRPEFPAAVRAVLVGVACCLVAITGDLPTCTFGDYSGATQAIIKIIPDLMVPRFATGGKP